jgi:hypothetical protein
MQSNRLLPPILFSGIKKITGKNYVERPYNQSHKNDILYLCHSLDNHQNGSIKYFVMHLMAFKTKF